jgi:threonine synthase
MALRVSEQEISNSIMELAREGVYACPEGAATLAALRKLIQNGEAARSDKVLLYNTGCGLKYGGHKVVLG